MIRAHVNVFTITGALILTVMFTVALLGPWLTPHDPFEQNLSNRFQPPNKAHWGGTDRYGRDTLSRVILGTRSSIMTAFFSVFMSACIGIQRGLDGLDYYDLY